MTCSDTHICFSSYLFSFEPLSKVYFRVGWHFMGILSGDRCDHERTPNEPLSDCRHYWWPLGLGKQTAHEFCFWFATSHRCVVIHFSSPFLTEPAVWHHQSHLIHLLDLLLRTFKIKCWDGPWAEWGNCWLQRETRTPLGHCFQWRSVSNSVSKAMKQRAAFNNAVRTNTWSAGALRFVLLTCGQSAHASGCGLYFSLCQTRY